MPDSPHCPQRTSTLYRHGATIVFARDGEWQNCSSERYKIRRSSCSESVGKYDGRVIDILAVQSEKTPTPYSHAAPLDGRSPRLGSIRGPLGGDSLTGLSGGIDAMRGVARLCGAPLTEQHCHSTTQRGSDRFGVSLIPVGSIVIRRCL